MIPFTMIVIDKFGDGPPKVTLAREDHPVEAVLSQFSAEPLDYRYLSGRTPSGSGRKIR